MDGRARGRQAVVWRWSVGEKMTMTETVAATADYPSRLRNALGKFHPYASRPIASTHTWLTPPEIIQALGLFDLDPCAAPSPRPWPTASRHIELPEDGLAAKWHGRVWCNPPFGAHTAAWLARM